MVLGRRDGHERRRGARWGSPRGWGSAAAALALAAGVTVALVVTLGSPPSGYRTAAAEDASVVKTVTVTGTVEPVDRVTLSFGVEGTVATVAVHVGERVTAGQTLATLATTALTLEVRQDKAALLAAQATVAADEKSQSAGAPAGGGGSGAAGGTSTSAGTSGGAAASGTTTGSGTGTTLQEAQQAVVGAQKTADAAEQAAASALSSADTACGTTPKTGTGAGLGTGAPTGSGAADTGGTGATACATALHQALGAQQALATDQQAVTQAETVLATVLAKGGSAQTGAGARGTGSGRTEGGTGGTGGTRPDSGPTSTGTPTTAVGAGTAATTAKAEASQLAGDQATVDAADATLLDAEQSLAEADLTSPIAGTVGAVDLASGQAASTGSGTPEVTILTRHTFEAEGLVNPNQVPALAVGDAVHVTVDGRPSPITGDVTRVGPVDTDLGDQYPVIVALPAGIPRLFTGSLCQMTVVLHVAAHALAVPTSAVHTAHGHSYVDVLDNGRPHRTGVAVGIVGVRNTQILSGLHPGEQVVLATLTKPLPKPSSGSSGSANRNFPIFRGVPPGGFFVTPTGRGSVTIYHAG